MVSKASVVAAIDSKEVNRLYLSDRTLVSEDGNFCKVRRAGPYFVMIAGIARATDGFDALRVAESVYRDGDGLEDFAARLITDIPSRLALILESLRAADRDSFNRSFRGQDVLQMSLLGTQARQPEAVVLAFRGSVSGQGKISVEAYRESCPGNCGGPNAVYFLGLHDAASQFLSSHPEVTESSTAENALRLIHLEYASHPEAVGGPATVIRVTGDGAVMEQAGACTDGAEVPGLTAELDRSIAAVENVVVREDVAQFSKRGKEVHSGELRAEVRVVDGSEEYDWQSQKAPALRLTQPVLPQPGLPQPWCGGEMATMLRVTRQVLAQKQGSMSRDDTTFAEPSYVVTFHATMANRYWQLVLGSRTYPLAFEGRAWFSDVDGKLLRLRWEATDLRLPASAGITEIEWDETFATSEIAGLPFLTPNVALYRVSYSKSVDRTDWTETRFSDFRRFGATENVRFQEASLR